MRNDVPVYCWNRKCFLFLVVIVGVIIVGIVVAQTAEYDRRHSYSSLKLCFHCTINIHGCLDTIPMRKLHFELCLPPVFMYDR